VISNQPPKPKTAQSKDVKISKRYSHQKSILPNPSSSITIPHQNIKTGSQLIPSRPTTSAYNSKISKKGRNNVTVGLSRGSSGQLSSRHPFMHLLASQRRGGAQTGVRRRSSRKAKSSVVGNLYRSGHPLE